MSSDEKHAEKHERDSEENEPTAKRLENGSSSGESESEQGAAETTQTPASGDAPAGFDKQQLYHYYYQMYYYQQLQMRTVQMAAVGQTMDEAAQKKLVEEVSKTAAQYAKQLVLQAEQAAASASTGAEAASADGATTATTDATQTPAAAAYYSYYYQMAAAQQQQLQQQQQAQPAEDYGQIAFFRSLNQKFEVCFCVSTSAVFCVFGIVALIRYLCCGLPSSLVFLFVELQSFALSFVVYPVYLLCVCVTPGPNPVSQGRQPFQVDRDLRMLSNYMDLRTLDTYQRPKGKPDLSRKKKKVRVCLFCLYLCPVSSAFILYFVRLFCAYSVRFVCNCVCRNRH